MKMCAGCITWTAIIVLLLGSFALTYYLYLEGTARQEEIDLLTGDDIPQNYHMYGFYASAVFALVLLCTVLCMYKKIRMAIKIMETSADFVTEVCMVLLVPPVMTVLVIAWAGAWVYMASYVYTNGTYDCTAAV